MNSDTTHPDPVAAKKLREAIANLLQDFAYRVDEDCKDVPMIPKTANSWTGFLRDADLFLSAITPHLPALTQMPGAGDTIEAVRKVIVERCEFFRAKEDKPDITPPGMTAGEMRYYYIGRLREMENLPDWLYPILRATPPSAPTNGEAAPSSWAVEAAKEIIRTYQPSSVDAELSDERDTPWLSEVIARHAQSAGDGMDRWEARTRWLMDRATYRGGGDGGKFQIEFTTPLDSECDIAQLDAAMAQEGKP